MPAGYHVGVDLETTTLSVAIVGAKTLLERATDAAVWVLALRHECECPSGVIISPLLASVAAEVGDRTYSVPGLGHTPWR